MKTKKTAFSLLELSIVLIIISIIVASTLSSSKASLEKAKIRDTKNRINEIYKALGNFAASHYRLPCPASLAITKNDTNYATASGVDGTCAASGIYISNAKSEIIYGAIPAATLGLPIDMAEDGFGNKIIYVVNKNYTKAEYPNTISQGYFSSDASSSGTTISTIEAVSQNVIDKNIFALMSMGANQYGAFKSESNAQNSTTSSDAYEQTNYPTITDSTHANYGVSGYGRVVLTNSNIKSEIFDDIILARTRDQMVIDFNLMFLIPCATTGSYAAKYYGEVSYKSSNCTTPSTVTPSKRCGPFGIWIDEQGCYVD